jgi:gliding motility-associated-like protein
MQKTEKIPVFIIVLIFAQLCTGSSFAQSLSATISSTPSICYNDGTLTINSSGGTAPYTYTLVSGPSNPNITYPVTLNPGVNVFGGLPHGIFTIQATDATGVTGSFSGTVGGNYQFPSMTFSTADHGSIIGSNTGGKAPYGYAISTTGSNTGFSPYQMSDTFSHLCPGTYWIRVRDSCGNIFTDEVVFRDTLTSNIQCINFSKGILDVSAAGGTAPYSYSFLGMNNTTGNFAGLSPYFADSLIITDACGIRYIEYISPPFFSLLELCPFTGSIFTTNISYPISPDTFTFSCLNCSPPQSVTVPYTTGINTDTLFRNQPPGMVFNIVIASSACGGDTILHSPVAISSDIQITTTYISCRSFQATVSAGGSPITVDSFVLSYSKYGQSIQSNTTGLFEQLPDSVYIVSAYIGALCGDTPTAVVSIPNFGVGCFILMKDASCHNAWEYSTNSILPERYSLIIFPRDTIASMPGSAYNANFYDLAPAGSYTLVSDSGCKLQLNTPPTILPAPLVVAYLPCLGQPVIQFSTPNYSYCNNSSIASASQVRIRVSYIDSVIYDAYSFTGNTIQINIVDSGWYHYLIYAVNTTDSSTLLQYDTLCPIDTGSVYMNNTQIPYLFSSVALVCDSSGHDTAFYQVYGGSAPYTVQIPGYDTVILQTNNGIFPTHRPGSYTMLVYDNCGISRSVTFNIVDTCSGCPYGSIYLPDTIACAGDTVHLISQSIHALTYQWLINGQPYSTARDTILISSAGRNNIMLIVTSATGCADTAYGHTTDTCNGCPYAAIDLPDTLYCIGSLLHLTSTSISGISYQWLVNGQPYSIAEDTTYILPVAGIYTIQLTVTSATACVKSATSQTKAVSPYTIYLGQDTAYCGSFSRVLSTGISGTVWSTGAKSAQITVHSPGTYTAQARNICGSTTDSIAIQEKPIPVVNLGEDTTVCTGSIIMLNAGNSGATYQWGDNATTQTLKVTEPGTYTVSVTLNGCTGIGAISVAYISAPGPFSLGKDTTICSVTPLLLEAYQPNSYYIWNTGAVDPFITVSESGRYHVTDSNACGKSSDSISITVEKCTCLVDMPTAFSPNGDGKNDLFGGIAWCHPTNYMLMIYDRWGQKLFTSTSLSNKWDGTYDNKPQPLAVYAYYMIYTDPYTNIEHSQSGNVTLIR